MAPLVSCFAYHRTGSQFFLRDSHATVSVPAPASGDSDVSAQQQFAGDAQEVQALAEADAAPASSIAVASADASEGAAGGSEGTAPANNYAADPDANADNGAQSVPLPQAPAGTAVPPAVQRKISFLLQLAFDIDGGPQFISALAAFASRTCYANADSDHLVGWANSSLRFTHELPDLTDVVDDASVGVVHADNVSASFACAGSSEPESYAHDAAVLLQAGGDVCARNERMHGNTHLSLSRPQTLGAVLDATKAERSKAMLRNLQSVPWGRVDCSWRGAKHSALAHSHIQVSRAWLNMEVCQLTCISVPVLGMCAGRHSAGTITNIATADCTMSLCDAACPCAKSQPSAESLASAKSPTLCRARASASI